MDLHDVARRLGMILSPAQEAYRQARQEGIPQPEARQLALQNASAFAAQQANMVHNFIMQHAVWTIPYEAWPPQKNSSPPRCP